VENRIIQKTKEFNDVLLFFTLHAKKNWYVDFEARTDGNKQINCLQVKIENEPHVLVWHAIKPNDLAIFRQLIKDT